MKKKILLISWFLLVAFISNAQRYAVIDSKYILEKLPEGSRFYVLFPVLDQINPKSVKGKAKTRSKTASPQLSTSAFLMSLMQQGFSRLFRGGEMIELQKPEDFPFDDFDDTFVLIDRLAGFGCRGIEACNGLRSQLATALYHFGLPFWIFAGDLIEQRDRALEGRDRTGGVTGPFRLLAFAALEIRVEKNVRRRRALAADRGEGEAKARDKKEMEGGAHRWT